MSAMPDTDYRPVPLDFERLTAEQQAARLAEFHDRITRRRSVRHYADDPVPHEVIDRAIAIAGSAPSGANMQPWTFVVVRDPAIKRRIREAAEDEERRFYTERATRHKHYYATESVGLACGFLLAALHLAGLATLTHTPSPMGFLSSILDRPANEKPFLLIPVGYPAPEAVVPDITRKPLDEIRINP